MLLNKSMPRDNLMNDITNRSALILLVEDDPSMLEGMSDLLQTPTLLKTMGIDYDVDIMTAENGAEALEMMRQRTPDIIVSDIMMPVMDGHQFLHAVQKNPDWLHIPFIFLTAKGNEDEILDGQLRGANLYITKPFISKELLELIKSQLDRSFERQASHRQNVSDLKKGILQILNHEFRTPLTYVTAYYEMLADSLNRLSSQHNFQEYLRGIQIGCVRLTKLIEDFILVIDLRTGEFQSRYYERAKPISSLNALAQAVITEWEDEAQQKGIHLHFTAASKTPVIWGDEQCLHNIFRQMLSNAIKFTPRNTEGEKHIYVSTSVGKHDVRVVFKDEGSGFPPTIQDQIFDLFFQYNRGLLEQQGAGTGLTIAKGLVDLHNGRIEVESQENAGSTFTVIFPIYTGTGSQQVQSANGSPGQRQATALVVEDDPSLLLGLKELLEIEKGRYQLNVLTAANGQEGLEVMRRQQPDIIISDIMMPIMDGYEFLETLRKNTDWIQIPFIFLTAKGEHTDVHRGLRSGVDAYITKPYDSNELIQLTLAKLDRYFLLRSAMAENFDSLKRSILDLITPDFRLPLSSVHEYSEKLSANLNTVQNDAELKESLHGIRDGSVRLTRLVEDFIALAELRTGEAKTACGLRTQPIHQPGFILCDASQPHKDAAAEANIDLQCEINDDLPSILGDSITLESSLSRLVEMGIKLCDGEGRQPIYLTAVSEMDDVCFNIHLPPTLEQDRLEKVLALLEGHDLNLSGLPDYAPAMQIAQGYIELNNGRLQIERQDNAYRMTVRLPIIAAPETPTTAA